MATKKEKELQLIEQILLQAPNAKDVSELCTLLETSRNTFYRFLKAHVPVAEQLKKLLGTNALKPNGEPVVPLKSDRSKAGKRMTNRRIGKTAVVKNPNPLPEGVKPKKKGRDQSMPQPDVPPQEYRESHRSKEYRAVVIHVPVVKEGTNGRYFDANDRWEYGKKVCEMVAMGVTITNACEQLGLHNTAFYRWINPLSNGYIEELDIMYKEAIDTYNQRYKEELVVLARNSMMRLASDREITNTVTIGRTTGDGKLVPHTVKRDKRVLEPNVAIVRDVMNKLFFDVEKKKEEAGELGSTAQQLKQFTDAELDAEEQKLKEKLKSLDD